MQAQKAEGTRDFIGAEMRAWQKMQQIAAGVFEPFGFKPSRRPRSSRWTSLSTASASRPTSCARRCSASLAAPTWSASLLRAPIASSSPSSAWRFVPRARPVWCAPSWRTTWCPRAPRRLRLIMPRPCSVASVPRRVACASSTRWASSGSALPIRQQTPSASSCLWSSTSVWLRSFQAPSAH